MPFEAAVLESLANYSQDVRDRVFDTLSRLDKVDIEPDKCIEKGKKYKNLRRLLNMEAHGPAQEVYPTPNKAQAIEFVKSEIEGLQKVLEALEAN